jgi:hypothetical protein
MTGALWSSGFVAALFAVHPLRAESVAWIAERKDVLSGVFFMLTLAAYVRYVRKGSVASYLGVVFVFALGLMSKPMLVTLPFVLLLLDYWPLRRLPVQTAGIPCNEVAAQPTTLKLILEKVPLLMRAAIAAGIALIGQNEVMSSIEVVPLWVRCYNAMVSYLTSLHLLTADRPLLALHLDRRGLVSILATTAQNSRNSRPRYTGWFNLAMKGWLPLWCKTAGS